VLISVWRMSIPFDWEVRAIGHLSGEVNRWDLRRLKHQPRSKLSITTALMTVPMALCSRRALEAAAGAPVRDSTAEQVLPTIKRPPGAAEIY